MRKDERKAGELNRGCVSIGPHDGERRGRGCRVEAFHEILRQREGDEVPLLDDGLAMEPSTAEFEQHVPELTFDAHVLQRNDKLLEGHAKDLAAERRRERVFGAVEDAICDAQQQAKEMVPRGRRELRPAFASQERE